MGATPPSRLPAAFVRVSKCPICRYSLQGIPRNLPCPECGTEIEYEIVQSPFFRSAVLKTRVWCTAGSVGWAIFAIVWWIANLNVAGFVISMPDRQAFEKHWEVWCLSIAGALMSGYLLLWAVRARRLIYFKALKANNKPARPVHYDKIIVIGLIFGFICVVGVVLHALDF